MDEGKEYHFDFVVAGLTEQGAGALFDYIIRVVDLLGGYLGGGYRDAETETETTTSDE